MAPTSGFEEERRTGPEIEIVVEDGLNRFEGRDWRFEEDDASREKRDASEVVDDEGSAKCRGPRGEAKALGVENIVTVDLDWVRGTQAGEDEVLGCRKERKRERRAGFLYSAIASASTLVVCRWGGGSEGEVRRCRGGCEGGKGA